MLNKWTYLTILTAVTAAHSLGAWGRHTYSPEHFPNPEMSNPPKDTSNHFPLEIDQGWFTKESYLLWKPHEDDVDYGNYVSNKETTVFNAKIKKPHDEWSSGVRVTIGRYLPKHDQWDVSLGMTYFYSETDSKIAADPTQTVSWVDPTWSFSTLQAASTSSVNLNMNLFIWDLVIGRNYMLTSAVDLHPFIGLRASLFEQKYRNSNNATLQSVSATTVFKAHNTFWGIGPRVGTDLTYSFGNGWAILGSLSGSFMAGHYDIDQKINGLIPFDAFEPGAIKLGIDDKDTVLRSNLEASIGLGWETWVRNHTVRIAPSFMVEGSEWFSMNHWMTTNFAGVLTAAPITPVNTKRHYGNLAFWGFSFNLQVDF